MQLNTIKIDGFGVLSRLEMDHFAPGLNVVFGTNGSGKTTLLQFLRGMFCNFDEARKQRLLPPLKGGQPGGSVEVAFEQGVYEIIRHFRPGHHDTLAIKTERGLPEMTTQIRQRFANLDRQFVNSIFFVGGAEAHSIDQMVGYALRDGIELRSERRPSTWIAERVELIEMERKDLFGPEPSRNNLDALERRLAAIQEELKTSQSQQATRDSRWHSDVVRFKSEIAELNRESQWLDCELQGIQAELTEVNDRLWSRRETIVQETQQVERVIPGRSASWAKEIAEIDHQIAHAQQVLRDLANSRLQLTLATTELSGTETPEQEVVFERQRDAIAAIEQQTIRLGKVLTRLEDSQRGSKCVCQDLEGQVGISLTSIKEQIALLCQELSRQQSASEQLLLFSQRDGVDRCEQELTRQIQGLRLKRDKLVHDEQRTPAERIQFCTVHEVEHCRCETHREFVQSLPQPQQAPRTEVEYVTSNRVEVTSAARRGDRERQAWLLQRKDQLQRQYWTANAKLARTRTAYAAVQKLPGQFAQDDSLNKLKLEQASLEQQLADAREQWHSLAVLQTVLQKTRDQMQVEKVSPVIEEASGLLREMTQGRYQGFRFNSKIEELFVVSDTEAALPVHALSRGTLEQASLSFRLALWNEYRRRGVELPLVLDEVLADSDEDRLAAAIKTLIKFSQKHHQIIFMTCQEHLALLFEKSGLEVHNLPGSRRSRMPVNRLKGNFRTIEAGTDAGGVITNGTEAAEEAVSEIVNTKPDRVQPDAPYWVQASSPVSMIPSLGEQMARRIGAIGVHTVGDLIELDHENTEIPLDSLQISAATLRTWQAEARLLCCVPELTGKDAQLLVLIGIFSPSELAQADADDLLYRFTRHQQGRREYEAQSWLDGQSNWPERKHFAHWIRSGHRARSYRAARSVAVQRRSHSAHSTPGPHLGRGSESAHSQAAEKMVSIDTATANSAMRASSQRVRLHSSEVDLESGREFTFYLSMSSPIVDAPSIGPKTAERFERIGVMTVADFVNRDATEMSSRLKTRRITPALIAEWQQQAILVCRIPELRGHDAQVLVACGLSDVESISDMTPRELFAIVSPFVNSPQGQRLLRSAKTPDLDEVTDWIEYSQNSRTLRAAA